MLPSGKIFLDRLTSIIPKMTEQENQMPVSYIGYKRDTRNYCSIRIKLTEGTSLLLNKESVQSWKRQSMKQSPIRN